MLATQCRTHLTRLGFSVAALAVVLGGCFFWHWETFDRYALVHPAVEFKHVVEIRQAKKHTGNAHMPFDFTVYQYDRTYEIRLNSLNGLTDAKDLELWMCGRRVTNVTGTVRISDEVVSVALDIPDTVWNQPKLRGDFRRTPASGPLRPCAYRKS